MNRILCVFPTVFIITQQATAKPVIFLHILVAHSKISHNKLIISTPHSTFICSYPSTFKITIKRMKKKIGVQMLPKILLAMMEAYI